MVRLTQKLINETIVEAIGEEAVTIVEFLKDKENISEFIISEETEIEIHKVRNILYKMQEENLAIYKRKKDSVKGYYISYWTFYPKRVKDLIQSLKNRKLDVLKQRLEKEEANKDCFFMCPNACVRLDFERGVEVAFKCPECGTLLTQQDNSRTIDNLKEKIKEMEEVNA